MFGEGARRVQIPSEEVLGALGSLMMYNFIIPVDRRCSQMQPAQKNQSAQFEVALRKMTAFCSH